MEGLPKEPLFLTEPHFDSRTILKHIRDGTARGVPVFVKAALAAPLEQVGLKPIQINSQPFYRFPPIDKPSGDSAAARISLGCLGIIVALPLLLIITVIVTILDGWPPLFRQSRVGYKGLRFTIYKIRTMRDVPAVGAALTHKATALGEFLRKHGLDELPQLWNLMRGDMRLVGPRPLPVEEYPSDDEALNWMRLRENTWPGLTGLYQVTPGRRSLGLCDMCLLDAYWLHNRSRKLDGWILLRTVAAILGGWGKSAGHPGTGIKGGI